ncbi:MAG: GTP cyclohydrolase I [Candidatus Thorarchaeota archaeon]|jgi:GTP cyclohydrolase I
MDEKEKRIHLTSLFNQILNILMDDPYDVDVEANIAANMKDSPERIARAWIEMTRALREKTLPREFTVTFPCVSRDMVVVENLEFAGVCPHHFLPVEYKCDIAYLPDGKALGLSKFHRIAAFLATRPMLQEELGRCVGEAISTAVYDPIKQASYGDPYAPVKDDKARGIIVKLTGSHSCMRIRGTKSPSSIVSTTAIVGKAFEETHLKQEFYNSLRK